jgi:YfiH family protein
MHRANGTEIHQVHGGAVHIVPNPPPGSPPIPSSPDPKADAVVCDDPRRVLVVRVADCVPVLLATTDGRWVAAVHAGWRGVIARVLPNAVATLRALRAEDLIAAIGPCIGVDHFEVGPEVVAEFERVFGADAPRIVRPGAPGKGTWTSRPPCGVSSRPAACAGLMSARTAPTGIRSSSSRTGAIAA